MKISEISFEFRGKENIFQIKTPANHSRNFMALRAINKYLSLWTFWTYLNFSLFVCLNFSLNVNISKKYYFALLGNTWLSIDSWNRIMIFSSCVARDRIWANWTRNTCDIYSFCLRTLPIVNVDEYQCVMKSVSRSDAWEVYVVLAMLSTCRMCIVSS